MAHETDSQDSEYDGIRTRNMEAVIFSLLKREGKVCVSYVVAVSVKVGLSGWK